jgi:hypothetical protein
MPTNKSQVDRAWELLQGANTSALTQQASSSDEVLATVARLILDLQGHPSPDKNTVSLPGRSAPGRYRIAGRSVSDEAG